MQNVVKNLSDDEDMISVYSFAGSIIIPTEQGSYWATAVGGVVEQRPTGNPSVLFSLRYIWDMAGQVSEFPEPIRIRLNTAMAVIEKFDFKFPDPEVPAEETVKEDTSPVEDELGGEDGDGEIGEGDGDGEIEDATEDEDDLADVLRSDDESELSW